MFKHFFGVHSKNRPIQDLRSAKIAARRAGHDGIIGFPNRGLLGRFAAVSRSSRRRKQPPQKRRPLNGFIGARRRYEKLERDAADLFAPPKKRRAEPVEKTQKHKKQKTFGTRITNTNLTTQFLGVPWY